MKNQDLEFIWILSPQGKIFIQRVFDRNLAKFDETTFSDVLATLSNFSNIVFQSSCEELDFGDKIVLFKSYPEFQVILSAKNTLEDKAIYNSVEEVGESFRIQYSDLLKHNDDPDITVFDNFGPIIDHIFGIETYIFLEEQDLLLKVLDNAISENYDEEKTIKSILEFLDDLSDYKVEILINNIGDNLKLILENVKGLRKIQKKRYKKII
jgi:hypothetical protein